MRVSTLSTFSRVLLSLRSGQLATLRAQEQLSSGRRILRPSDDPAGAALSLALQRDLSRSGRIQDAIGTGRSQLDLASSTLQHSSELMTRTRELLIQAMSGTLTDRDRDTIATELGEVRKQLLDDANLQFDGRFVLGGTRLGDKPWTEVTSGGATHAIYQGDRAEQEIQAGEDVQVAITAAGDQIFGRAVPGPVRFDGLTGLASGSTADEGSGYAYIRLRHDSTAVNGLADIGAALVAGGGQDTLLGSNTLVIDGAAGTIQLGSGPLVHVPSSGDLSDVVVSNEYGGELHLDMQAWTGGDLAEVATGQGSISLDGQSFTALTFGETDLELSDPALGQVLHLDTRGVKRAGTELATFGETTNPFDLLQGIVDDLRNDQGLSSGEVVERLSQRLTDLDRVHEDLLAGLGLVGSRSARLANADSRQSEVGLELTARLSSIQDADLSEVALDLARSQMMLEVAQAAGARVIQASLLQFLR